MSKTDITVLVGGEAGQGILTIGELLAEAGRRAGFYAACVNDFESRIRGGHSFSRIRISHEPVLAPSFDIHLLVALDEASVNIHLKDLTPNGLALVPEKNGAGDPRILAVSFEDLAKKAGGAFWPIPWPPARPSPSWGPPWTCCWKSWTFGFHPKAKKLPPKTKKRSDWDGRRWETPGCPRLSCGRKRSPKPP